MLETTPRHWNGVVCVWIEGCTLALMQSSQREILGIASHALMTDTAATAAGSYNPCGQWVRSLRGGASGGGDWAREEAPRANVCFNEHTSSHTFYNFETAWGLLHWSWCLFPGLLTCQRRPRSRGLLQHSGCNNYRLTMLYDLVETPRERGGKQLA